jgi:gamma-glutamyltranspeptidase/glutathione hydrolase
LAATAIAVRIDGMASRGSTAAVATPHPAAAAAGSDMLLRGGNAVDAAVAAMLACCVVEPAMVGLGGYGGSMVARLRDRTVAIDFDSRAPLAYRAEVHGTSRASHETGYLSITVPAVVAGLDLALSSIGTLPWSAVSEPAIALAEGGIPVTAELRRQFDRWFAKADAISRRAILPTGALPDEGAKWVQRDLAKLLRRLFAEGPATFYQGDIRRAIVRQVREQGGLLSEEDFASYRPTVVEPSAIDYRGHRVLTPPPPSGGVTALQILKTLEQFDLSRLQPWGAEYLHLVAEGARLCWHDRSEYFGDPDVTPIPVEYLLSIDRAKQRAARIRIGLNREPGRMKSPCAPHTANILAADRHGNVVSMTATHGYQFGSAVAIDGLGLVMGHGMSRFDQAPGNPNSPAAGKRMYHNMAPTIVLGPDGQPRAAVGLPGGTKIVTVTAQLVVSLIDFAATPDAAVHAGRIHAEADGPVAVSSAVSNAVIAELEAMGHAVRRGQDVGGPPAEIGGVANALLIDPATAEMSAASQAGEQAAVMIHH